MAVTHITHTGQASARLSLGGRGGSRRKQELAAHARPARQAAPTRCLCSVRTMSASQEDLRAPWMWDELSRDDAVAKLEGKPEGTFLARPGSQPNTWSFTMVKDGRAMHVRRDRAGG